MTHAASQTFTGPATRYNFRLDMPVNILKPFAIMTQTSGGLVTGVIVKGTKK
jgi:hypothetical protein